PFPHERRMYYGAPLLTEDETAATYVFRPIPGSEAYEDGPKPAQGWKIPAQPQLNADEFVAAMWRHNVRYGFDIPLIKRQLRTPENEEVEFAHMLLPVPGRDARAQELVDTLHRSNAPKILPDGRVDLLQFQNRFPHVDKNTRLIKKIPPVAGKPGRDLSGAELVPEPPQDIDLRAMAGLGTRIDNTVEGEILVADISGFVQVDPTSRIVTISEKIVNKEGVSLRTTGNLVLPGDHYEEHGVVQEKASVEGKHMTYMADVFGDIVSRGGNVLIRRNLVGGSVRDPGGTIVIDGKASRAVLEAPEGEVRLHYAENCRIAAARVHVTQAVHCEILAREISIESAEACAIVGQKIELVHATTRHDIETTITLLVPDVRALAKRLEEARIQQSLWEDVIRAKRAELEQITEQPEMKSYLVLNAKVKAKAVNMTAEQSQNWDRVQTRIAPQLRRIRHLNEDLQGASSMHADCARQVEHAEQLLAEASGEVSCQIADITGETVIRAMNLAPEQGRLETLGARDLRKRFSGAGGDSQVLLHDSEGEFFWIMPKSN
ncbi:MAG TPA: flagellar assembly protein A, partial [Burkholderiaceae bacterium]